MKEKKNSSSLFVFFLLISILICVALAADDCSQFYTPTSTSSGTPPTLAPSNYPGKQFLGGYFTLQLTGSDASFAYYRLYFSYFVRLGYTSAQVCCDDQIIASKNQIGFGFGMTDFAVNCNSACMSADGSNSSTLGYMGGVCMTYSVDESFTVITSTFALAANLNSPSFEITNLPQSNAVIDWIPLSSYFNSQFGYRYRLAANLTVRDDTGSLNNPPLIITDPVITVYLNINRWITIPVFDIDEDFVVCKFLYFIFDFIYNLKLIIIYILTKANTRTFIQENVTVI